MLDKVREYRACMYHLFLIPNLQSLIPPFAIYHEPPTTNYALFLLKQLIQAFIQPFFKHISRRIADKLPA